MIKLPTKVFQFSSWRPALVWSVIGVLVLLLGTVVWILLANVFRTAFAPLPATPGAEDFGQYLADHQTELTPFFSRNNDELIKGAVPLVMELIGWVMLWTIIVGWVIDVVMTRGFSPYFARMRATWKRAVIYATGRLVLSVVLTALIGGLVVASLNLPAYGVLSPLLLAVGLIVALGVQIGWILFLYRSSPPVAAAFYGAVIAAHSLIGLLFLAPVLGRSGPTLVADYIDKTLTPKLQAEAEATKHEAAEVKGTHDGLQNQVSATRNELAQAQSDEDMLTKEIAEEKNSEAYLFAQIAKVRAQGDLPAARDQFTQFLARFPLGSMTGAVQTQLAQIDDELARRDAAQKQAEADAIHTAQVARADLLDRTSRGEATLSEMREALIGKNRNDVRSLFGSPTEIASDRWGYGRQMIVNPLTNEKYGLTVYFIEGVVQSVDYYYGKEATP